jgi:predicted GNAT family acetyltransferase
MADKPKFDPSQPFQVTDASVGSKPAFDPSQPFQEVGPVLPPLSDADFAEFQKQGFNGTKEELQRQIAAEQAPHSVAADLAKNTVGLGEAALHVSTGIPAALAGGLNFLGTLAATRGDVDAAKAVQESTQNALTYQPRSDAGQAQANLVGKVMALPGKAGEAMAEPTVDALTKMGASPEIAATIGAAVRTAPDAAVQALGLKGGLRGMGAMEDAVTASRAAAEAKANAPAQTPTEVARAANYNLRPSDVAKVDPDASVGVGKKIEKFSGSGELRKDYIEPNQANTTSIAAQDIGLPKETKRITQEHLDDLVKPHVAVYKEVGDTAGTFRTSPDLQTDFDAIANRRGLEPDIRETIAKQVDKYRTGFLDGPDAVKTISALRQRASKQMQSDDVGVQDRGVANRAIADAMEGELGRQVSDKDPGLVSRFQEARTQLAKINNVDAATRAGQVDAHVLNKLQQSGVPLSGGLKIIADTAENFPWVTKHPLTYADIKGAKTLGGENFYNAVKAPLTAVGRKILGSDTYQNTLGAPVSDIRTSPKLSGYFDRENKLAALRQATAQSQAEAAQAAQRPILRLPAPGMIAGEEGTTQLNPGTDFARQEMGLHEVGNARQPPLSALSDTLQGTIRRAQAEAAPKPIETIPYTPTNVINPESFMPGMSPRARMESGRARTSDLTTDEPGGVPFNPPENVPPLPPRAEPLPRPPPGRFARLAPGEERGAAPTATISPGSQPGYFKINVPGESTAVEVQGRTAAEDLIRNLHEPEPTDNVGYLKSLLAQRAAQPTSGTGLLPHKPWGEILSNINKRNAPPDLKYSVNDAGEHVIESPVGAMIAQETGNGQLKIKYAQVKPEARGNQYGQAMLKRMVQEGEAKGLQPVSDFSVSEAQQRVYAALKRDGYTVKQNPSTLDKKTGELVTDDPTVPVYEISSPKAATVVSDIDAQLKALDADAAKKKLFYSKSPSERLKKLEDAHIKERRRLLALKKAVG